MTQYELMFDLKTHFVTVTYIYGLVIFALYLEGYLIYIQDSRNNDSA